MTLRLMMKKFGHYICLLLGIIACLVTQKQIDVYQTDLKNLNQERQNLTQKINQARQKKIQHEKIMRHLIKDR